MAGNKSKNTKNEYDLDQLVQNSFGYTNSQLLKMMQEAEETVGDDQIPPEPEDGFEQLMAKMEQRGIKPYSGNKEPKDSAETKKKRPRTLRALVRIAVAATILGSVLAMTSITAGAKRGYKYVTKTRVEVKNSVVLNSQNGELKSEALELAYIDIQNQMGIKVLELDEIPQGMIYLKTATSDRKATMYFEYQGESIYFIQQIDTNSISTNFISDRAVIKTVHNMWLEKEIPIECAETDDGQKEFSAQIVDHSASYYLSGIMEEAEFIKIVEGLNFAE